MIQLVQAIWRVTFGGGEFGVFDYWRSSRVIDTSSQGGLNSCGGCEITEFPFFSFLYADLHAHLIALPFAILALGLGLALVLGAAKTCSTPGLGREDCRPCPDRRGPVHHQQLGLSDLPPPLPGRRGPGSIVVYDGSGHGAHHRACWGGGVGGLAPRHPPLRSFPPELRGLRRLPLRGIQRVHHAPLPVPGHPRHLPLHRHQLPPLPALAGIPCHFQPPVPETLPPARCATGPVALARVRHSHIACGSGRLRVPHRRLRNSRPDSGSTGRDKVAPQEGGGLGARAICTPHARRGPCPGHQASSSSRSSWSTPAA